MSTTSLEVKGSSGTLTAPSSVDLELSADDIELGRLLLIQQTKPEGLEDTKFGDIHETVLGQKVGGIGEPVEVVPLTQQKLWKVFDPQTKKFVDSFPANAQNMDLRDATEHKGVKGLKHFLVYRFLVLLAKDVKAGGAMPYILEFKSTSLGAGKKINTQFMQNQLKKRDVVSGAVVKVGAIKMTGNGNTYAVYTAMYARDTSDVELQAAVQWRNTLSGKQIEEGEDPF